MIFFKVFLAIYVTYILSGILHQVIQIRGGYEVQRRRSPLLYITLVTGSLSFALIYLLGNWDLILAVAVMFLLECISTILEEMEVYPKAIKVMRPVLLIGLSFLLYGILAYIF